MEVNLSSGMFIIEMDSNQPNGTIPDYMYIYKYTDSAGVHSMFLGAQYNIRRRGRFAGGTNN